MLGISGGSPREQAALGCVGLRVLCVLPCFHSGACPFHGHEVGKQISFGFQVTLSSLRCWARPASVSVAGPGLAVSRKGVGASLAN